MRRVRTPGPFEAEGVAWTIHRERVVLAGWGSAILLQLAHPKVARGVAEHSGFTTESWGRIRRLRRTLHSMLALTFGTPAEAAAVAGRINAIHDRVHGHLPEAAGDASTGAPYSAHDPDLLSWVHATLLDSFLLTYRLFVRSLTEGEADRYCGEASGIEPLLGIPAGRLPRTVAELRDYLADMQHSGAIEVTETARELAREVISPPAPRALRPLLGLAALPAVGLLPPAIRVAYGFAWDDGRERRLRLLTAGVRAGLPFVPGVIRYWPAARRAARRERGG